MRHAFEIVRRWVKRVEEWLVNVLTIYKNHLVCLIVAPLWSPVQAEWKGFKACHWLTVRLRLLPLLPFALSPSHFTSTPPCLLFSLSLSLYSLYLYLPLPLTYTQTHTHRSSGSESVEADVLQQMDSALVQGAAAAAATFVAAAENSVTLLVWKVREWRAEGVGDG